MSAPSQYVEVVPAAGGGVPAGSSSQRSSSPVAAGPGSAVGAAADAVASADRRGVVLFGAALAAVTVCLVAVAVRRHVPKG
jgi:hypothetical protein